MRRGDVLVERCSTGIPGFDELCEGGFVKSSVNAVLGGPGSGKTSFLLQFLWNGATKYNENGLFISFEPDVIELFKDAAVFGWDFQKLDAEGRCKFMKVSPETSPAVLKEELVKVVSRFNVKRICFDPISLFAAAVESEIKERQAIFELTSLLKRLDVTVLISDEITISDSEEIISGNDIKSQYIKFLTDGLVDLYSSGLGGVSDRAIRIAKMRRTNHVRGPIPMQITDNGIVVLSQNAEAVV